MAWHVNSKYMIANRMSPEIVRVLENIQISFLMFRLRQGENPPVLPHHHHRLLYLEGNQEKVAVASNHFRLRATPESFASLVHQKVKSGGEVFQTEGSSLGAFPGE